MAAEHKKNRKWLLWAVIALLAAAVAVLAVVNKGINDAAGLAQAEAAVTVDGEQKAVFSLEWLRSLPAESFDDNIKENGKAASSISFTGVELKKALDALDVDISKSTSVSFRAQDGYVTAASMNEVNADKKIYIVYERSGVQTLGKSEGGTGPMEIIITGETFSLRNCKFLTSIDFE